MGISPAEVSAIFLLGLAVGSFLNVCIWRLPVGEQVVQGRSHCRSCGKQIAWHDNIPLLSFACLRGRCRHCQAKIPWSYPFVELATGLLLVGVLVRFGWSHRAVVYGALAAALLLVSMVDLKEMVLPDEVTLPGTAAGIVLSFFLPELHHAASRWSGLWAGVWGAAVGAGGVGQIRSAGSWWLKQEAMGLGDVKLMAMVGSLIGVWKALLVILILGPFLGVGVGLVLILRRGYKAIRLHPIPYGPLLALGTMIAVFWGDGILEWYLGWF